MAFSFYKLANHCFPYKENINLHKQNNRDKFYDIRCKHLVVIFYIVKIKWN